MRDLLPKSTSIARELAEINFLNLSPADRLTAGVLQGLVNREEARICSYTGALFDIHEGDSRDLHEDRWLDLLEEKDIRRRPVSSLEELIAAFPVARGVILYDEDNVCERNIALMLGAQKNLLPATVAQARRFGLARAEDLRGRFASAMIGYRWALDEIMPRCQPNVLCSLPAPYFNLVDYLVAFKIFTMHLPLELGQEAEKLAEDILCDSTLKPVLGVWDVRRAGMDTNTDWERLFIDMVAETGNFFVVSHECANLSVYSALPPAKPKKREQSVPPAFKKDKSYLTFIVTEGDNLSWHVRNRPNLWEDEERGKVPIGWSVCPALYELCPHIAGYYERTATANDEFVLSMCGAGYTFPSRMGRRLAGGREAVLPEFLKLSGESLKKYRLGSLQYMDHGENGYLPDKEVIEGWASIENPPAGIFSDYPYLWQKVEDGPAPYVVNNTVVAHAAFSAVKLDKLAEGIRAEARLRGQPAFLYVFTSGWAFKPTDLVKLMEELGDEYVALKPEDFCALFRQAFSPLSRAGA